MSTDTLTRQMHESRARRLIAAETRAAAAEATRKDLEERLAAAEARASLAEDRARDVDVRELPGIWQPFGRELWIPVDSILLVTFGGAR